MQNEKNVLTFDEAVKQLPDRENIHTFLNPRCGMLIGADWPRPKLIGELQSHADTIRATGPAAAATGHGLAFFDGMRTVFVETKAGG